MEKERAAIEWAKLKNIQYLVKKGREGAVIE